MEGDGEEGDGGKGVGVGGEGRWRCDFSYLRHFGVGEGGRVGGGAFQDLG